MMRFGIWSFAHVHAAGFATALQRIPDFELVGIADDDVSRGQTAAKRYNTRFFTDATALLAHIDAVIVMSPNVEHRRMTEQAAAAGVHVLTDKPIATTIADGEAMIQACREAGVVLAIAFPCPFSPAFEQLLSTVQNGALGQLIAVRATNRGYNPGGWFNDVAQAGGGAVMDHTVHVADLLRRLTGSEFTRVHAEIGNGIYHGDYDDTGILNLTLENGVFATLDCSWSRPESFPVWGDVTLLVAGTHGTAYLDIFNEHVTLYPRGKGQKGQWLAYGPDLTAAILRDFVEAIETSRPPRSTGEDGLAALAVALAAYESDRRQGPVRIEEIVRPSASANFH